MTSEPRDQDTTYIEALLRLEARERVNAMPEGARERVRRRIDDALERQVQSVYDDWIETGSLRRCGPIVAQALLEQVAEAHERLSALRRQLLARVALLDEDRA